MSGAEVAHSQATTEGRPHPADSDVWVALDAMGFAAATEVAAAWWRQIESRVWLARDGWLPGVEAVLERLRAEGVRLEVLTARQGDIALCERLDALEVMARADEFVVADSLAKAITMGFFTAGRCGASLSGEEVP